jgi:hypothetical protein
MGIIKEQWISMKITVEPVSKVLVFSNRKCEVIPQYLYYLCIHLLEKNEDIRELASWSVRIEDTLLPITQLKDMENWD